jgi:DNA replication protein DnaC
MEQLQYQLKSIRLSGMANALPVRLQEARSRELPHLDFLTILVEDELSRRRDRLLERRLKAARFPERKTLDTFDFYFNPAISKQKILELASARFVVEAANVLFLGPPGVGKSHLAIAIGISAVEKGFTVAYRSIFDLAEDLAEAHVLGHRRELIVELVKPNLLIIDEFGMKKLPGDAAEDLLEVFHRRYHHGANLIATNRPLEDWGKLLDDTAAASAILDRFLESIHLVKISGRSYRLRSTDNVKDDQKSVAQQPTAS